MNELKAADMTQTNIKITPFNGRTPVRWAFPGAREHFGRIKGPMSGTLARDSQVMASAPSQALMCSNLGQVVHTCASVTEQYIIWL